MRLFARLICGSVVGALCVHGCIYPDFVWEAPTTTAGTTAGGTGTATGVGTSGGGSETGTTAGTATGVGAGGTGGAGAYGGFGGTPGPCAACTSEQKCTIVDEVNGTWGCGVAGARGPWSRCFTDADCAENLWCDHTTETCKPICHGAGHCPPGAQCIPAEAGAGGTIPNFTVCTSHCHPQNVGPCHSDHGATNCVYRVNLAEFDCWASLNFPVGAACADSFECAAGLLCAGDQCWAWCGEFGILNPCDWIGFDPRFCVHLSPVVWRDGQEFGACVLD